MRLLLMNTCGAEGVVALADQTGVLAVERLPGRGTSEHLMPAVRRLFEQQGARVRELTAVAVVVGPGSFTGARVGLSAAKGLCEAGAVPLVAMSRLALVAAASTVGEEEVLAMMDAGREEFFCGVYRAGQQVYEALISKERALQEMSVRQAITCEARVAASLGGVALVGEPGPAEMLTMTLRRVKAGEWSDVAQADANYLRRTDAELLRDKG